MNEDETGAADVIAPATIADSASCCGAPAVITRGDFEDVQGRRLTPAGG